MDCFWFTKKQHIYRIEELSEERSYHGKEEKKDKFVSRKHLTR